VREGGEKEITEIVTHQAPPGMKAILKQAAEKSFVLGQGHHAIADVAGRKDTILAAKAPRAAAVIGNGNDGGEAVDGLELAGGFVAAARQELLKAPQQGGKARAAAERDDVETTGVWFRVGGAFLHSAVAAE
jgi:hypothetical protein